MWTITPDPAPVLARPTLTLTKGVAPKAIKRPASPDTTVDFYFVWSPARNSPRVRHASRDLAIAEADRLSAMFPGTPFDVFGARRVARCLR
jgi:hypothetical protein